MFIVQRSKFLTIRQRRRSQEPVRTLFHIVFLSGFRRTGIQGCVLVLIACAGTLGGCLGDRSPVDQFYQLALSDPHRKFDSPPLQGTLQVARPWANALTGERSLLYRKSSQSPQVYRHTYHRWVDSPTILVQQEMIHYLRSSHLADQVVTPKLRVKVDYILSCQIVRLERILDDSPRVVMELELGISSTKNNQALLLRTYREEQVTNNDGIDESVTAYNHALANILDRFLTDVAGLGTGLIVPNKSNLLPGGLS